MTRIYSCKHLSETKKLQLQHETNEMKKLSFEGSFEWSAPPPLEQETNPFLSSDSESKLDRLSTITGQVIKAPSPPKDTCEFNDDAQSYSCRSSGSEPLYPNLTHVQSSPSTLPNASRIKLTKSAMTVSTFRYGKSERCKRLTRRLVLLLVVFMIGHLFGIITHKLWMDKPSHSSATSNSTTSSTRRTLMPTSLLNSIYQSHRRSQ